jgi:hypothetical protein
VVFAGAALLTALVGALALLLGAWAFGYRRYSLHEGRLSRLVEKQPSLAQVVRGLEDEGASLVATPESGQDLLGVATVLARDRKEDVLAKGRRWPKARVFVAGDMVYFLYFDGDDVMRDYVCVGR